MAAVDGESVCTACAAGKYLDATNGKSCESCRPGSYSPSTGQTNCEICGAGAIAPAAGALGCDTCPAPETTNGTGARNCSACQVEYYYSFTNSKCESCSSGFDCSALTSTGDRYLRTLIVEEKFYRFSRSAKEAYKCSDYSEYPSACEGGRVPGDASCKGHSTGPLCRLCKANHFHNPNKNNECTECVDSSIASSMVPVIVVVIIGAGAAIAWRMKPFQKVKEKLFVGRRNSINLEWWAITARIIFRHAGHHEVFAHARNRVAVSV